MTVDEIREYQQIRTPDYAAIANYVLQAKGPDRTMAQFAEETQIGASTLSRIINRVSKKPLSVDTIITIFEHRAEPDNLYLLEALARANGLLPKEYANKVKDRESFQARRNDDINNELMMKNALIAAIAACGMPIKSVLNGPMLEKSISPIFPRSCGDFAVAFDADRMASQYRSWTFFLFPEKWDEFWAERARAPKNLVRRFCEHLYPWFVVDAWKPEEMKDVKFSFAFLDEALFNEFVDAINIARVHTEMTVLLMDSSNYQVLKEVWLPGNYTQISNISVFDSPAPSAQEEPDFDEDSIYNFVEEDAE